MYHLSNQRTTFAVFHHIFLNSLSLSYIFIPQDFFSLLLRHLFNTWTSKFDQKGRKKSVLGKIRPKMKREKERERKEKKWMCWSNTGTRGSCDVIMWPKLTCPTRFWFTRVNRRTLGPHRTPSIGLLRISTTATAFSLHPSLCFFSTVKDKSLAFPSPLLPFLPLLSLLLKRRRRRRRRRRWRQKLVTCNTWSL